VVHVERKKHALDISLLPAAKAAAGAGAALPAAGSVQLGRITTVGGTGVRVQLSARSAGRVALTDIHDGPVKQALAGLQAGQYCKAVVLGVDPAASSAGGSEEGGSQLLLSLRPAAGGQCAAHAAAAKQQRQQAVGGGTGSALEIPELAAGPLQPKQLKPGQRVAGYVKSSGSAGVFVCLARNLDARIRWVAGWLCGWRGWLVERRGFVTAPIRLGPSHHPALPGPAPPAPSLLLLQAEPAGGWIC
jgi:rRNA biogenesis protein RRP5